MTTVRLQDGPHLFCRLVNNYARKRPICMSFEVTHSCTCNCVHCDKGGLKKETNLMPPSEYRKWIDAYKPCAIQISGGEPLTRSDLLDVIKSIRGNNPSIPIIILVTNGSLLNEEKFLAIKKAGVNRLSISLDFPDERHDDFRRHKGLYKHLEKLVPYLAGKYKGRYLALNCAITHANMFEILNVAKKAREWNVEIAYSAYSALRTKDESLLIRDAGEQKKLEGLMEEVIAFRRKNPGLILNPAAVLRQTVAYFKNGGIPGCRAGERYFVVRPDGLINACSMFPELKYKDQKEAIKGFTKRDTCEQCFVAIRANTEKSLFTIIKDNLTLN